MARDQSSAVRVVGALVPPSLLGRLTAAPPQLSGLRGADYHLAPGESPRAAANRAWAYLTGVWPAFKEALAARPAGDAAVSVTREKWLQILFGQLGYGRLPSAPSGGVVAGDRTYPVSHLWGSTPVHLLGWGVDLDRRTASVAGAAQRAPHPMVQELLNRSDDHVWGVVSNGRVLRLLRDSTNLSVQSYVEFDLEAIFDGELFADFVLLFLLAHQSRVEVRTPGGPASDCWLEAWRTEAIATGARALDRLRDGVQDAVEVLGTGLLANPANDELRRRVRAGEVTREQLHASLLQLVYRLLFLFVAEDRGALLTVSASREARDRYERYYSTARLRRLARTRVGTRHGDAWATLRLVIDALGREGGCPQLGLPGLGGLFEAEGPDPIAGCEVANAALFHAVRSLSVVVPKGQERPMVVDYRSLGAEELGSIYESLLELVPVVDVDRRTLRLESHAGNDRKTSGSYYTPSSLIDLVLDETLTPLLDEATASADPERAILAMTVCDPACGSGHFLVAAARRLAERLATARTSEADPTPDDLREALADVVERCIYGVDLNPMAAQLAKVSLWLEAMRPGRPLSFLDAHIKVGNALLGATPELVRAGVPDAAFTALVGDDKQTVKVLKKSNKGELRGADTLFSVRDEDDALAGVRDGRRRLASLGGAASLAEVHAQRHVYEQLEAAPELVRARLAADTWCAAFVAEKTDERAALTTSSVRAAERGLLDDERAERVRRLAAQYRFFHWHLEFPEVFDAGAHAAGGADGRRGGFTAMVGNPPWETVQMSEQEFFAARDAEIAGAPNAAARKRLIASLPGRNPALAAEFAAASRATAGQNAIVRGGRFPLTARGKVNTYAIFAEHFRASIDRAGRMGIITPTGLATDATTAPFFADSVAAMRLAAFYDFDNEARIFPGVHHAFRFAVTAMTGGRAVSSARLAFVVRHVEDVPAARFELAPWEIITLNPNTRTLPVFRTRADAEITLGVYRRHPVLVDERQGRNPWGLSFKQGVFNMASDSGLFRTEADLLAEGAVYDGWAWAAGGRRWLPLYEAKMLGHYDHRLSTYAGATQAQLNMGTLPRLTVGQHQDPFAEPRTRYWVAEEEVADAIGDRWDRGWFLGWRDVTNAGNERTFIPSVLPCTGVNHKFPLAFPARPEQAPLLQAVWSSLAFDYVARQKISGPGMPYFIVKQLAAPAPEVFDTPWPGIADAPLGDWVRARVLELTYTSHRLAPYARDVLGLPDDGPVGGPFRWDPERRAQLQAELDAAMLHVYGLDRGEAEHVLDAFPVVRKYEERDLGEYRTKRLVLAAYDAMAQAASAGGAYASPLVPPAGNGPRHPQARDD